MGQELTFWVHMHLYFEYTCTCCRCTCTSNACCLCDCEEFPIDVVCVMIVNIERYYTIVPLDPSVTGSFSGQTEVKIALGRSSLRPECVCAQVYCDINYLI